MVGLDVFFEVGEQRVFEFARVFGLASPAHRGEGWAYPPIRRAPANGTDRVDGFARMRSERTITVAVGRFGDVIGRGLLQILGEQDGMRVVGAGLGHAALERRVARGDARVVVLDEDSVARPLLCEQLREARPDVGLVVFAHRPSRAYVTRTLAFGVGVCLSTDAPAAEIVRGVRLAAAGRHAPVSISPRPARAMRAAGIGSLTRREREVLEQLSRGRKNAEIAEVLQIGTETARTHARHVYRKLGVSSRWDLLGVEE